jgi:hypothetical protein
MTARFRLENTEGYSDADLAALNAFLDTRRPEAMRAEAEYLIPALARAVIKIDASTISASESLRGLRDTAVQYNLGALLLALCEAARTLFDVRPSSLGCVIEGARQARRSHETSCAPLPAAIPMMPPCVATSWPSAYAIL